MPTDASDLPAVTYVMPVLNEADAVGAAVASVLDQDYPAAQEVVLALGPSTDGTDEVVAGIVADNPAVRTVANPATDIPAGLNRAIAAARHPVIVRVDAHTQLPPGYTRRMVSTLLATGAANVGGVMRARGATAFQRAVARVYNSPLGLGGGVYHGRGEAGPADSAYLGVFRREVLEEVGGYDESLRRGEDYELNQRIRGAGHLVWFDPDVDVAYWPRRGWSPLARQMWATGTWRGELVRRQGRSSPRYLAPPLLVLGLGAAVAGLAGLAAGGPVWLAVTFVPPVAYAGFLGYAGSALGGHGVAERGLDAAVLAVTHLSWGAGFLKGWANGAGGTVDTSRLRPA